MPQEPAAALEDANQFDITGPIVISYSRTSPTGTPLLSYRDAERDLSFSGTEISRFGTPGGEEFVTITLEQVPDALVRTFTLVVPRIRLRLGDRIAFDAFGVETTHRSTAVAPPRGPSGVVQTYRVHQLGGAAQLVIS